MAIIAIPNDTPPSFGGTSRWIRTSNPLRSSDETTSSRSVRFWNTPPESATRLMPVSFEMRSTKFCLKSGNWLFKIKCKSEKEVLDYVGD